MATEIDAKGIGRKEFQKSCCNCNCSCNNNECKEYILRAQRNYRLRKQETDPNYKENERIRKNEYIEKNKEQYNEGRKLYMREYRARKKAEQNQKINDNTIDNNVMENTTEIK